MKGLEITGENLEDLLAYDDLFLDYFNAFLALPVFPQPLVYNRLTGAFEEVDENNPTELSGNPVVGNLPLHYGATDAEREKMLEWARQERLPLFLKTQLFRELKLVKLLLRPLDERQSASRGSSRNIRGYSRQTETYVSSLSNSVDNSGHDVLEDEELWGDLNYSALYQYQRPGSRALSVPIKVIFDDFSMYDEDEDDFRAAKSSSTQRRRQSSSAVRSSNRSAGDKKGDTAKRAARISSKVEVIPDSKSGKTRSSQRTKGPPASSTEEAFRRGARALSAPVTYEQFRKMPPMDMPDFDAMFGEDEPEPTGQAYVTFEDDHVSEEQTETDMRNMEGRLKMTIQQMKEQVLSTRTGFERFREFLSPTTGFHLLDFWLDCENFKDTMEDFDENKQREIASMLFRDIQDKYKLKLTQDAKDQIIRSTSHMSLSHTIFLRTQYDVLRRLRAYWLPRYLTHCERTNSLQLEPREPDVPSKPELKPLRPGRPQAALFPSISLVHSMPVLPEEARNFTFAETMHLPEPRGSLFRAASSMSTHSSRSNRSWLRRTLTSANIRSNKERFLQSLAQDRQAGGPFQRYLSKRLGDEHLLSCLLFWQDVTEYGATEDKSADRLLRLCHAWHIYTKYLSEDSKYKVEISEKERTNLHQTLQSARDFIEASIFDTAKTQAVGKLEKAWIRYLKEDLKAFLDCRVRVGGESPPSTAEAIEITVTDQDVLIKRPRPWVRRYPGSAASERARRLQKALIMAEDIDEERRAERKREALERRKEMERERRKAIKAAYARQREAKKKKPTVSAKSKKSTEGEETTGEDGTDGAEKGEEKEEKSVTYQDLSSNRQVMSMFRKYLNDMDGKEVTNLMQLYQEIETYFSPDKGKGQKKDTAAAHIYKTYLDPQAKKFAPLANEKVQQRVAAEKDRPKSGTLKEIQKAVLPKVEETFKDFLAHQSEEFGVDPQDLVNMSQAELAMRMGSDQSLYNNWQKRKGQSRGKHAEAVEKEKEKEEEKERERRGISKIGTMQFESVKVNVYEGGQNKGRFAKQQSQTDLAANGSPTAQPKGAGQKGPQEGPKPLSRRTKVKLLAPIRIATIPEGQLEAEGVGETQGDSQGTGSGLFSTDGPASSSLSMDAPSLLTLPRKYKRGTSKTTGRAQPSREDKNEFLHALGQSAAGQLSVQMLYFYKYLLKHGEEDGMPQLDKDLFFYIEVQKFKDCSHAYSDEEMLRRKVQSIVDCFLDSVYSPTLQVDIISEIHQKTMKAAQRYLGGKEGTPSLFDEAQFYVFKELLPYWAGFKKSRALPEDPKKRPVTKYEKMLKKRMENIENYKMPSTEFTLPSIPEGAAPSYTITLSEGVKYRLEAEESVANTPILDSKEHRGSRLTVAPSVESLSRRGRKESVQAR